VLTLTMIDVAYPDAIQIDVEASHIRGKRCLRFTPNMQGDWTTLDLDEDEVVELYQFLERWLES
jgi:hypothetical protein